MKKERNSGVGVGIVPEISRPGIMIEGHCIQCPFETVTETTWCTVGGEPAGDFRQQHPLKLTKPSILGRLSYCLE